MRLLVRVMLISLLMLSMHGCSSLARNEEDREITLKAYMSQAEPLVLYASSGLQSDEQLRLFGMDRQVKSLNKDFPSGVAMRELVERFITQVPALKDTAVRIVEPARWGAIQRPLGSPVFFFYGDWHMVYPRLPPDMRRFRLQAGVTAKVIPLGQVLSGKGTLALRTASWEGRCVHDALNGGYFSIAEWRNDGASLLHQAVSEVQELCTSKLALQFQGAM